MHVGTVFPPYAFKKGNINVEKRELEDGVVKVMSPFEFSWCMFIDGTPRMLYDHLNP